MQFALKLSLILAIITFKKASGWLNFPSNLVLDQGSASFTQNESNSELCGPKLLMSDLLEDFLVGEAKAKRDEEVQYVWREAARVDTNLSDVKSYAGFFTVNKKYNSNMFFWFVPAAYEPENSPVMLWLNGGPGTSSLFGLFVENGPFKVNNEGYLENRSHAWSMSHSMLYIDNPVGTGFSFTDDAEGYSKNQKDISENLFECLQQFFRAFPEYLKNDLYIAGESYAGKYVPSLGIRIHFENRKKTGKQLHLNLKGLIIGSGFFDPWIQNEYGEHLFYLGLIDGHQKTIFLKHEAKIKRLIENEEWMAATNAVERLIVGDPESPSTSSLFQNITGFSEYLNILESTTPREYKNYVNFLNTPKIRKAIHVGNQPYTRRAEVLEKMGEDISKSVKQAMERLLKENYRVLIYSGQLDIVVPHTGVTKFVENLEWPGSRQLARTPRRPWKVNGDVAGYGKFAQNLAHVLIRNAGHTAPYDQSLRVYDMIKRFTRQRPFG